MRRLYSFVLGVIAVILVLFGVSVYMQKTMSSTSQSNKLVIYNWGDYIAPDLITKFTDETGIEVQYETFDSNESMYTKIKQGGTTYDIAVPSDYMIDKMRKENLLIKLDKSKITGLENIGDEFLGLSFDENNDYSIPYFWGTLGIVYNDTMVENAPEHWSDLWNSELTPNIKAIVGDEMKGYMINGDAAIGVTFSGEASEMLDSNEHLHYVVPSEGSNLWFDNLVIPKTAKHVDEAYAFINFMLRPENAAQNAEYIGYSTPNDAAKELLPDDVKNDQAFYPSEDTIENLEVYDNLGQKWLGIYNDLYLQFKMYRK